MKLAIIGYGPGGVAAAVTAKTFARDTEVTIITEEESNAHRRPGISLAIRTPETEVLDIDDWSLDSLKKKGINVMTGTRVIDCDMSSKTLITKKKDGTSLNINFDKLIIATGGVPIVPPVDGADLEGVLTIKNIFDARMIGNRLDSINSIVVIGAGFSGLEMAEQFHRLGKQVHIVIRSRILRTLLEEELSNEVLKRIPSSINVHIGSSITSINGNGHVESVTIQDKEIPVDAVICMTGVRPNIVIAEKMGLKLGPYGGILVNHKMETSNPDVYAVGDCAEITDSITGKTFLMPVASMAARGGRQAAVLAIGLNKVYDDLAIRYQYDRIFSTDIISIGLSSTLANDFEIETSIHYFEDPAEFAKIALIADKDGRLVGGQVVAARMGARIGYQIYSGIKRGVKVSEEPLLKPRYTQLHELLESTLGPIRSLED